MLRSRSRKRGGGSVGSSAFNFNPATARYIFTGDSITALDDDTGFLYWGQALGGGAVYQPPYMHQGVSGSEINEGTVSTNTKDLLYPARKQLLVDAAQAGDIVAIAIGTNSVTNQTSTVTIDGLKELYAAILDKGAFIEAYTILPSASNIADARTEEVNTFIRSLDVSGMTYNSTSYPASKFMVVDGYTAWGGTYVGHTDSGNLHPNAFGAIKIGRARRDKLKSINRAYHKLYGTTNPSGNLLTNWNLAAGTAGTITGTGNTLSGTVPTGIAVAVTANAGLTVVASVESAYSPIDSLYAGVAAFPVLKLTVTGTAAVQADITITMSQNITTEALGNAFDAYCYSRWKGIGVDDPTGLYGFGFGYGSVVKWASANTNPITNYTNVTLGGEGVLRGRSIPPVSAFGNSSIILTSRVKSGETASFEIYFGQPYAAKIDRTAYAAPKFLNTNPKNEADAATGVNTETIGGVLALGPRVVANTSSDTAWTAVNGDTVTGRPGGAIFGGAITYQFTWQKITGGVISDVSGPTTVTATLGTTQYTISGVSGDKFRLKVVATNSFGSATSYSVWSSALP